ncbi:hypothetical protein C2S51_003609 [Perilla frutescens var. frutescens]|nr:hypothetical protein C2S51_003609 [Perilla frutescens var. frutescens]
MAFRVAFFVLMLSLFAMAMVAHSGDYEIGMQLLGAEPDGHGLVADALDMEEEMMMESESARRQMRGRGAGHISYGALNRNNVPCNQRGASYYNCRGHQAANPYKRGCSKATRCARNRR